MKKILHIICGFILLIFPLGIAVLISMAHKKIDEFIGDSFQALQDIFKPSKKKK